MLKKTLALAALLLVTASTAGATHAFNPPPGGYACVGGYNALALTNVCHYVELPTATPGSTTTCVYVIGNIPGCTTRPTVFLTLGAYSVWLQAGCNPSTIHSFTCTSLLV